MTLFLWTLMACTGKDLAAPVIDAPDQVPPVGEFSVKVSAESGADLSFWWLLDDVPKPEFSGATVSVDVPVDGQTWTVIVIQEVGDRISPPGTVDIDIVDEGSTDEGQPDTGAGDDADSDADADTDADTDADADADGGSADDTGDGTDTGRDTDTGDAPCTPGESLACPAGSCGDVETSLLPGTFWFGPGSDMTDAYQAVCAGSGTGGSYDPGDPTVWMRVVTLNHGTVGSPPETDAIAAAAVWTRPCSEYGTGAGSLTLADWSAETGFEDPGTNPGACTQPVRAMLICPRRLGASSDYRCFETEALPDTEIIPSLHSVWTGDESKALPRKELSVPGDSEDILRDYCSVTATPADLRDMSWVVGADDESVRMGFYIDTGVGIVGHQRHWFGAGLPAPLACSDCGHGGVTSFPEDGEPVHCSSAVEVWIR